MYSKKNHSKKWINEKHEPGLVSVIVPTYNSANFICDALQSVHAQTYRPIEVIIVDDGSTDNTRSIIKEWNSKIVTENQFIIHYFKQQNKGGSAARNFGILKSQGEYIQFLDADDVLAPGKIESQVSLIAGSTDKMSAYGPWRHFENTDGSFKLYKHHDNKAKESHLRKWIGGWFAPSHSLLWRRTDIKMLGPWDENLAADQDGEYALRFLTSNGRLQFCESAWVYYRHSPTSSVTSNSVSTKKTSKAIRSRMYVTRRIEKFLSQNDLLNDEYRQALSSRYYDIAKDWAMRHKVLRKICLRHFRRLSPDGLNHGTLRNRILTKLFGFVITQKLRFVFRDVFGIPGYLPVATVKTIDALSKFDV